MNITVNLEQIILEGIDIAPSQRPRLQAAVEEELSRLLQEKEIPKQLYQSFEIPSLPATIQVTKGTNTKQIGIEIAQSIYSYLQDFSKG